MGLIVSGRTDFFPFTRSVNSYGAPSLARPCSGGRSAPALEQLKLQVTGTVNRLPKAEGGTAEGGGGGCSRSFEVLGGHQASQINPMVSHTY